MKLADLSPRTVYRIGKEPKEPMDQAARNRKNVRAFRDRNPERWNEIQRNWRHRKKQ